MMSRTYCLLGDAAQQHMTSTLPSLLLPSITKPWYCCLLHISFSGFVHPVPELAAIARANEVLLELPCHFDVDLLVTGFGSV